MSAMAKGPFTQLLLYQWEEGNLPGDVAELAELAGLTDKDLRLFAAVMKTPSRVEAFEQWIWPELEPLLPIIPGGFRRNPRLEKERRAIEFERERRSARGRAGGIASGKSRQTKHKGTSVAPTLNHPDADADEEEEMSGGKRPTPPPDFAEFWEAYPANAGGRKPGKRKALELWKRIPVARRPAVALAARRYAAETESKYVRHAERFLANSYWEGYVDAVAAKPGRGRDALIEQIVQSRWEGSSGAKATAEGIEGMHGVEPWKAVSTERLRKMVEKTP